MSALTQRAACQGQIFIESSQNVFPSSFLPPLNLLLHFRTLRMNFFNDLSWKLDQICFMHVFIRGTADLNEKWLFLFSACTVLWSIDENALLRSQITRQYRWVPLQLPHSFKNRPFVVWKRFLEIRFEFQNVFYRTRSKLEFWNASKQSFSWCIITVSLSSIVPNIKETRGNVCKHRISTVSCKRHSQTRSV